MDLKWAILVKRANVVALIHVMRRILRLGWLKTIDCPRDCSNSKIASIPVVDGLSSTRDHGGGDEPVAVGRLA